MEFNKREFTKFRVGKKIIHALIDAPHATNPKGEYPTGQIADNVSKVCGCHCIIGMISRTEADLNRPPEQSKNPQAIYEYRAVIQNILNASGLISKNKTLNHSFLHLQIHGMKDRSLNSSDNYDLDIEIGTRNKTTCSPKVHDWIVNKFINWGKVLDAAKDVNVGANKKFRGDPSKAFHRHGDNNNYRGYGANFHTVQVEFTQWLRKDYQSDIEEILCQIIDEFSEIESEYWHTT